MQHVHCRQRGHAPYREDEHEVPGRDSSDLVAYPERALAFQDKHELVVVRLDMDDVLAFFENVDVA